ncbi:hypothetical protein [Peribacillus loiseleuriae]|uniref:Uncharacterized protein n=1 Tax=Peribacillus loiseleuriae TaxID=1679170 RepID=A0A0K9G7H0_9BACI|nr:hypothetical protein [Peribacillus loiseleuriae]KMY42770.1 hypothetical protein AC625_24255 [Peribacillus loiseleuriae]
MKNLNSRFQDKSFKKTISTKDESESPHKRKRQTHSDKCHNIKFPVTTVMQMKLRTYCKQMGRIYYTQDGQALSQTVFNTSLLQFGLHHIEIVDWNQHYKDTKTYMHTMLKEQVHQTIGGPYGLAIQKQVSERKVVVFIMASVLLWIEKGGSLEKILQ